MTTTYTNTQPVSRVILEKAQAAGGKGAVGSSGAGGEASGRELSSRVISLSLGSGLLMPYSLQQNLGTRELKNCSENDNEGAEHPQGLDSL